MSYTDIRQFDRPPGLDILRTHIDNGGREQDNSHYYSSTFSLGDRKPSHGTLGFPGYSDLRPRSITRQEKEYGYGMELGPNNHNSNLHAPMQVSTQTFSPFNHHHRRSSPPPNISPSYHSLSSDDRDVQVSRVALASVTKTPTLTTNNISNRTTLCWGEIEPWMDEEYVKQVCKLMGWDPMSIKVSRPAPDPVTGQQANNPGFCYLTFSSATQAASALAQVASNGGALVTMPNSTKPFVLNWAHNTPTSSPAPSSLLPNVPPSLGAPQQYPKEYSIFVGDLAPETSNSDLVAVFRNPVLGLRNDREPKFIRPFTSCKSAKIMLDPVTGVSRGYGFVRFTDEADQQRALIEMHGLYCLSRPMRISPATAKYKAPSVNQPFDIAQQAQFNSSSLDQQSQPVTVALPLPDPSQAKSVSVPVTSATSNTSLGSNNGVSNSGSGSSLGASNSTASLSSGSTGTSISSSSYSQDEMMNLPNNVLVQIAHQYAAGETASGKTHGPASITQQFVQDAPTESSRYTIPEESWKHHAQARAILGNLMGPNGEQLTSTDPYNTTVFVGGLSPLISEDTLRTFFAPFGDIHYVKVPVGKHCGFVQYVRKADAERAIQKLQGFPIGGSRIRLSWGRSQYKAAQAAAQAAQAAALQSQFPNASVSTGSHTMTQEQAIQLLQKLNTRGYIDNLPSALTDFHHPGITSGAYINASDLPFGDGKMEPMFGSKNDRFLYDTYPMNGLFRTDPPRAQPSFAPFSPDPNPYVSETRHRDSFSRSDVLPHPSKAYAPGFYPQMQDCSLNTDLSAVSKTSPTSTRPSSATRYNNAMDGPSSFGKDRVAGRPEATVSSPTSAQASSASIHGRPDQDGQEFDALQDLNGTLASLDLDRPWRSTSDSSDGSTRGSMQFKPTSGSAHPPSK